MLLRLVANRNRNTGTSFLSGPGFYFPPETGASFYSRPNASSTLPGEPTMPPLPAVT